MTNQAWIEKNKDTHPFTAGALAFILGQGCVYGCHFGMRSTRDWAKEQFAQGWHAAHSDYLANDDA